MTCNAKHPDQPETTCPMALTLGGGYSYEQHAALKVQHADGTWWCPNCEEPKSPPAGKFWDGRK